MHLLEGSLCYRSCRRSFNWLADVSRASLTGRSLAAFTGLCGRYAAGSCILGTGRIRAAPLETAGGAISVQAVSRLYAWLRRGLADAAPGEAVRRSGGWVRCSTLAGGRWTHLAGSALLGAAIGRAVQGMVIAPIAMAAVGLLLVIWGPSLAAATGESLILGRMICAWRGDSERRGGTAPGGGYGRRIRTGVGGDADPCRSGSEDRGSAWLVATGVVLSLCCGLVAGLVDSAGPYWLAAGVLVIVGVAVLLWRPETMLLFAAAFPWLDALARDRLGGLGAAWDEVLLVASIALILWGALVTGRLRLRTVPIVLPVLCALTVAVGSIVVRGVPNDVGMFGLRVVLEPLLFYFIGFLLCSTPGWVHRTVTVFLASTTALALHGLYQFVMRVPTPSRWVDSTESSIVTRAFSVIGNPNGLGSVLAVGALVAVALLLSPALRKSSRFVLALASVVQLAGLAVTFSRGAWIGVICGLIAMLLLAYRRYLLPLFILGAAGVLAVPGVFADRFLLIFSDSYLSKAAVDGRIYRWIAALDQIGVHPWFGVGLGTYGGSSASRFGYWVTWVDNFYLQIGAEGGLLLLVAFLWVMLRVAKGAVRGSRIGKEPFERAVAAGVFGGLIAVAVANLFASVFETLAVGAALWLLAGLATAATFTRTTGNRP